MPEDTPPGVERGMAHTTLRLIHATPNTEACTTYKVGDEPLKIGTDPKSDIKLYDSDSARFHATIERDERGDLAILHLGNGPLIEGSIAGEVQMLTLARGVKFKIGRDEFEVEDITIHVDPVSSDGYFWIEGPNNTSYLLVSEETKKTVATVQYDDADRWKWSLAGSRVGGTSNSPEEAKVAARQAVNNAPPKTLWIFGHKIEAEETQVGSIYEAKRFPFRGKVWTAPDDPTGGMVTAGPDKFHWALFLLGVPGAPPMKEGVDNNPITAAMSLGMAATKLLAQMSDLDAPWY